VAGVPLLHEHAGKPGQVLLVLRDISRITQLEQAGEEYAVNVSHELKTPLTLILGYTETLLADPNVTPEFRTQSLRTIERHSRRILRIVDDLLRLAWLQSERDAIGGVPITPTIVADVVAEAVSVCAEWAQQADIAIQTDIPVGLVWGLPRQSDDCGPRQPDQECRALRACGAGGNPRAGAAQRQSGIIRQGPRPRIETGSGAAYF